MASVDELLKIEVATRGNGYKGVFVETAKADFNKLFQMLVTSPGQ